MEPTPSAPAPGVQSSASPDLSNPDNLESLADNLMDAIVKQDERDYDPISAERRQPERPESEREDGEQGEQETEGDQPKAEAKPGEQKVEKPGEQDEGEEYASLDDYLGKQKLDPESFMSLPVKVTVDGQEQQVPLAELAKGYELKQASYARMQEAAKDRQDFSTERSQVRQALGVQIQRTEALIKAAQDQLMGDYGQVTQQQLNELRVRDPGQYAAFMADYNQRVQAVQSLMQQADAARQEQGRAAQQEQRATVQREMQKLVAARPEWRDPAKAAAATKAMQAVGKHFGFTEAEMNGIFDHRYMLVLDLAAKQLHLQASSSATLKRVRSAPRMAKPGTRQVADPKVSAYSNDRDRALKNPTDDNMAAAFEHFVP